LQEHDFTISRRDASESLMKRSPKKNEGAGKCRVPAAPAARVHW